MDNLSDIKMYLRDAHNNIEGIDLSEIEYAVEEAESAVSNMRSYLNDAMSSVEDASYNTTNALEELETIDFSDEDFMRVPTEGAIRAMSIGNKLSSAKVVGFSLAGEIPSITVETISGTKYTISGVITDGDNTIRIGG